MPSQTAPTAPARQGWFRPHGNFYGVSAGGAHGGGTVFKITPAGTLTTLYSFCAQANCADGSGPSGLVQATDGNFYGTTGGGGASDDCSGGCGTAFKITPTGKLTTLHSFDSAEGSGASGLVQATDGNFYGTTGGGGASGSGTVFKITPAGELTTLHSFDLFDISHSTLVQGSDGSLYGETAWGGALASPTATGPASLS